MAIVLNTIPVGAASATNQNYVDVNLTTSIPISTPDVASGFIVMTATSESFASEAAATAWDPNDDDFYARCSVIGETDANPPYYSLSKDMGRTAFVDPTGTPTNFWSRVRHSVPGTNRGFFTFRGGHFFMALNPIASGSTIRVSFAHAASQRGGPATLTWVAARLHQISGIKADTVAANDWDSAPFNGGERAFGSAYTGTGEGTFDVPPGATPFRNFITAWGVTTNTASTLTFGGAGLPGGSVAEEHEWVRTSEGHIGYIFHNYDGATSTANMTLTTAHGMGITQDIAGVGLPYSPGVVSLDYVFFRINQ